MILVAQNGTSEMSTAHTQTLVHMFTGSYATSSSHIYIYAWALEVAASHGWLSATSSAHCEPHGPLQMFYPCSKDLLGPMRLSRAEERGQDIPGSLGRDLPLGCVWRVFWYLQCTHIGLCVCNGGSCHDRLAGLLPPPLSMCLPVMSCIESRSIRYQLWMFKRKSKIIADDRKKILHEKSHCKAKWEILG